MSEWIEAELAESQMHDKRHAKRLAHLLERLSEQAVSSIPRACQGWAETIAAYRFLDNSRVGRKEILAGHQHATRERLLNAIAIYLIIAWRIHTITMMGRAYPEASCEVVFEPREWQTLYTLQFHSAPPPQPPPLRNMVRALARLGGFLACTGDGEPGIQSIWQGYQRLHEFSYALETHRAVNAL